MRSSPIPSSIGAICQKMVFVPCPISVRAPGCGRKKPPLREWLNSTIEARVDFARSGEHAHDERRQIMPRFDTRHGIFRAKAVRAWLDNRFDLNER